MAFHIHAARTPAEIQTATELIRAYVATLGVDLAYQDFATEIASMPGKYAPPEGEILLAIDDDDNENENGDVGAVGEQQQGKSDDWYEVSGEEGRRCQKCERKTSRFRENENEAEVDAEAERDRVLGCVALRALPVPSPSSPSSSTSTSAPHSKPCELKRLFVHPTARGRGVGRALLRAIIALARGRGYTRMVLDTLSDMRGAMALYREVGFEETEAYYRTPVGGTVFFALRL